MGWIGVDGRSRGWVLAGFLAAMMALGGVAAPDAWAGAPDATSTAVSCVYPGGQGPLTCTATVTDTTSPTRMPSGVVAFQNPGGANNPVFVPAGGTCALTNGTCSVDLTPASFGTGKAEVVNADYQGNAWFAAGNGSTYVYNSTPPEPAITTPADGAAYVEGAVPDADFFCIAYFDPQKSCTATVDGAPIADGAPLPGSVGPHTFVLTATAVDDRFNTAEVTYSVTTATSTTVSCVYPGGQGPLTCTATVADVNSSHVPSGVVAFQNQGGANNPVFVPADGKCTLKNGTCSVDLTPASFGTGKDETVTGAYQGNAWNAASTAIGFVYDGTPPFPAITTPADGASYAERSVPDASFFCIDGFDPEKSCTATVDGAPIADGAPLPGSPGTHTFVLTGTGVDDRTATQQATYTVTAPLTTGGVGGPVGTGSGSGTGTGTGSGTPAPRSVVTARLAAAHVTSRGTTLSFTLSAVASVRVEIVRLTPGHRVKGVCRAGASRSKGKACATQHVVRRLTIAGRDGLNRHALGVGLTPGRYRATFVVAGATSQPSPLRFTVVTATRGKTVKK